MEPIHLSDDLIFAEGGRRYCFVHPDDPNKCVKTLNPNGDPRKRKKEAVWYKKLRPVSMFDDNKRELKSFEELAKKGEAVWNHFPHCYGIQSTNRGDGIVTDLIRDADGLVSKTVRQYVAANGKTTELLGALEAFFNLFRKHLIITRDVLDHNLVVQAGDEKLTIYMIDGFGSSEVLPFSRWLESVGEKKVARKIARFSARYNLNLRQKPVSK
ncbi:MAG: hypothetical protein KAU94_08350 [Verrucomicrobia bacterium]|nr:hypothetical protein [Verrucomicrobiota bacterium]